jgi:cytochrome P450
MKMASAPRPNMTPDAIISRLRLDSVTFASELAHSHGDIVELPLGKQSLFLLNSPAYIHEIFTRSDIFKKRPDEAAENSYLGQIGGFSPMFGPSLLSGYSKSMIEASERTNARWQNAFAANGSLNVDIYREMMRVTLEIVVQTLFQMDVRDQSADLVEAILQLDTGYGFDPLTANLGHLLPAGPERAHSESDAAARARVQAAMQRLFDAAKTMPEPPPLIATLIKYVGENAVGVAVGTMLAMHEVAVTTVTWAWYFLSQYPDVETELHAEWARVLGGRPPTYEDVPKLVYTDQVLSEVRRLFPSVWMVLRFVREDTTFDGYAVPAGSVVMASQQLMHRDPRFFREHYRFDPSRWTPEGSAGLPEYAYFPFSQGARACAGGMFAKLDDAIILATLGQHWRPRLVPGQHFRPITYKSNAPRPGIEMSMEPRGPGATAATSAGHAWPRIHS